MKLKIEIKIPAGWRSLKPSELIAVGDMVASLRRERWEQAMNTGIPAGRKFVFIRKI
jgi:hypothetical protein